MSAAHGLGPLTTKATGEANQSVLLDAAGKWVASIQFNGEPLASVIDARAQLLATAPDLLSDLRDAAAILRKYEVLHRAKGTAESDTKAEVNAALATRFDATIAKATGGTP